MRLMRKNAGSKRLTIREQLGARIQEIRKRVGLTQEKLAEAIDVHPSFVGSLEAGMKLPSLTTLIKIAQSLKVPSYHLLMLQSEVPAKNQAIQELVDLLNLRPEKDATILLTLGRALSEKYPRAG